MSTLNEMLDELKEKIIDELKEEGILEPDLRGYRGVEIIKTATIPELENAGWIPVEERLPDNLVNPITRDPYVYPVTVDLGGVTDMRYYSFWRGHWYNQGPKIMDGLVIAWMPLPEPYRTN